MYQMISICARNALFVKMGRSLSQVPSVQQARGFQDGVRKLSLSRRNFTPKQQEVSNVSCAYSMILRNKSLKIMGKKMCRCLAY